MKKLIAIVITLIFTFNGTGYCLRVPLGASARAQKTIEHIVHPDAIPWDDVNAFVNAIDSRLGGKGISILDAFVFGSRANRREKGNSDVDIGIFIDRHIALESYRELKSLWKGKLKADLLVYSYDDLKEVIHQMHPEEPVDEGLLEEMKKAVGSLSSDAVRIQVRRPASEELLREAMRRTGAKGITEISFHNYPNYPRPGTFTQKVIDAARDKNLLNISLENLLETNGKIDFGRVAANLDCLSSDIANASRSSFNLDSEEMTSAISKLLQDAFTDGNKADINLRIILYLDMGAKKIFAYDANKALDHDGKERLEFARTLFLYSQKEKDKRPFRAFWDYEKIMLSLGTEVSIARRSSNWRTGLFDYEQCQAAFQRYIKNEPINRWRLWASLAALSKKEQASFIEWAGESKKYLIGNTGRQARYMPAFELWEAINHLDNRLDERYYNEEEEQAYYQMLSIAEKHELLVHGTRNFSISFAVYSQSNHLQDHWALLNIMIEGELSQGDISIIRSSDLNFPENSARYGPYFIIFNNKLSWEEARRNSPIVPSEKQAIYLVPREESAVFLRRGIEEAVRLGFMSRGNADEVLSKIMTYKQFNEHDSLIPDIINGRIKPSDILIKAVADQVKETGRKALQSNL